MHLPFITPVLSPDYCHFLSVPHHPLPSFSIPPPFHSHFLAMSPSISGYVPFTYVPGIACRFPTSPFMSFDFLVVVFISCHFHFLSPACRCISLDFPFISPSFSLLAFLFHSPLFPLSSMVAPAQNIEQNTTFSPKGGQTTQSLSEQAGGFQPDPCFAPRRLSLVERREITVPCPFSSPPYLAFGGGD